MRVLVQRVSSAAVSIDGQVVGAIRPEGQGLLAFVGVTHSDDLDKTRRLAEKLWKLRILADESSAADIDAPILVVSQFTLYADTAKGRRPSWNAAAPAARCAPGAAAPVPPPKPKPARPAPARNPSLFRCLTRPSSGS